MHGLLAVQAMELFVPPLSCAGPVRSKQWRWWWWWPSVTCMHGCSC